MPFAAILFIISLLGIMGLFSLKFWEERRGGVVLARLRAEGDEKALALKSSLEKYRHESQKLYPTAILLGRYLVHEAALGLAKGARGLEAQAHRLADMVSHKHAFQRRETRSQFLREVSEYKSVALPRRGLDTTY